MCESFVNVPKHVLRICMNYIFVRHHDRQCSISGKFAVRKYYVVVFVDARKDVESLSLSLRRRVFVFVAISVSFCMLLFAVVSFFCLY